MRKLVFCTQKLDADDPVLAATVPMARALAERVDELVVLCDAARSHVADNVRVRLQKGAIANVLPKGTLKSA